MRLPDKWSGDYLARLFQGIGIGAVATIVVGFGWGGWTLGGTAAKLRTAAVEQAYVTALAPGCAEKFAARPGAAVKKAALLKADSWKRDEFVPKKLITLPGATSHSSDLLEACFKLIKEPMVPDGTQAQKG